MNKQFNQKQVIKTVVFISIALFVFTAWAFLLSACDNKNNVVIDENEAKAKELASTMTLEEKVGQLFIIRPEAMMDKISLSNIEKATGDAWIKEATPELIQNMQKYNLGGLAMFAKNIKTPEQTSKMIQTLKENSKFPLFFGIDEEGGIVARIANNSSFGVKNVEGGMQGIGATGNPINAFNAAEYIGSYLEKYNFNLDFAPVCDVNTNPKGNNMRDRSFSSDPNIVANMVEQYINGLHEHKVLSTVKHFPGTGDESADTHHQFVIINKTWDQLQNCELIPFKKAIEAETDFVMIGHDEFPNVTGNNMPASLSKEIIANKLKNELGFKGIVITDGLEMKAINDMFTSDKAAVTALKAGVDILLMPSDFELAYNGVINAVKSGEITEDELNEHLIRVLTIKEKYLF